MGQPWLGNVRELQTVVETAAYHAHHHGRVVISRDDIPAIRGGAASPHLSSFHERTERFKLQLVEEALAQCGGSQVRAARLLRLDRGTLRRIVARSSNCP
jgi:DNA-binding NtrC family response regulator